MAELALNVVLAGDLPRPKYRDALAIEARRRWHEAAVLSLGYGEAGLGAYAELLLHAEDADTLLDAIAQTRGAVEAEPSASRHLPFTVRSGTGNGQDSASI